MSRSRSLLLAFALALAFTGCSAGDDRDTESAGGFAGMAQQAADEIREEMATEDIDLGRGANDEPAAKLTPQGDLVIGGEKVAMTDEQRAVALEYRAALAQVAETGARVGLQGAALAGDALKLTAAAALSGNADTVESQLKDQVSKLETEARALCDTLPDLMAKQQRFAEAVPAFVPYANMDQDDLEKCMDEARDAP
ncbi:MAG TPA: hypothetical protein VFQ84_06360 [Arenimonas sp.]|uniref:hypothetical protein n=1 Tax=Arenimonas sp. TaxID=1872635 RepID=UPI002D7F6083|nr:hypothetical protein [Arenimonas sp.]HEU0152949.1 hypothetical protein [Arenimonas sp.]